MASETQTTGRQGPHSLGWIGTGRMGYALAERLLANRCDLRVFNRTRSKAMPLEQHGARVVEHPSDLASCDVVFTMVGGPDDVLEVTLGAHGVLSKDEAAPRVIVDSTTINPMRRTSCGVGQRREAPQCWLLRSAATPRWSGRGS